MTRPENVVLNSPGLGKEGGTDIDHPISRDAEPYTVSIREQFSDIFDVYNKLLGLVVEFRSQRIDSNEFLQRLLTLSAAYPQLIEGFNKYLPAGYLIECTVDADYASLITIKAPDGTKTSTETTESPLQPIAGPSIANSIIEENLNYYLHERYLAALECMERVKQRFAGNEELKDEFNDILKSYPPEDYEQFVQRITDLFRDSPDLFSELRNYFSQEMLDALDSVVADSLQG